MLEFYHISDLHFGKIEILRNYPKLLRSFLERLHTQLDFANSSNKYLLVTGDITDGGTTGEYNAALEALSNFKNKIFIVPGNHDYGLKGCGYDDASAKRFDDVLCSGLSAKKFSYYNKNVQLYPFPSGTDKFLLIGLNSCLMMPDANSLLQRIGISFGLLGYQELTELNELLSSNEYSDYKTIVLLHHIPTRYAKGFAMDLLDRGDLITIASPRIDAICYGHEGALIDPCPSTKSFELKPAIRPMKIRRLVTDQVLGKSFAKAFRTGRESPYDLDANNSVEESKCYKITTDENNQLKCDLIQIT